MLFKNSKSKQNVNLINKTFKNRILHSIWLTIQRIKENKIVLYHISPPGLHSTISLLYKKKKITVFLVCFFSLIGKIWKFLIFHLAWFNESTFFKSQLQQFKQSYVRINKPFNQCRLLQILKRWLAFVLIFKGGYSVNTVIQWYLEVLKKKSVKLKEITSTVLKANIGTHQNFLEFLIRTIFKRNVIKSF